MIKILNDSTELFSGDFDGNQIKSLLGYAIVIQRRRERRDHEGIIEMVCNRYGLEEEKIYAANQHHEYCKARAIVYKRLRDHYGYGLKEIGDIFGLSHATVMNGLKNMQNQTEYQLGYKSIFGDT